MTKGLLVAATIVAAVVACVFAASAQAALVIREPFGLTVQLCNGHAVSVTGTEQLVGNVVRTPSGGFIFPIHVSFPDLRGVDPATGTIYNVTAGQEELLFTETPAGGMITTIVTHLRIQGPDGELGIDVRENLHVVDGPDGTLRAFVDTFVVRC